MRHFLLLDEPRWTSIGAFSKLHVLVNTSGVPDFSTIQTLILMWWHRIATTATCQILRLHPLLMASSPCIIPRHLRTLLITIILCRSMDLPSQSNWLNRDGLNSTATGSLRISFSSTRYVSRVFILAVRDIHCNHLDQYNIWSRS